MVELKNFFAKAGKRALEKNFGYSAIAGISGCFVFSLAFENIFFGIIAGIGFFALVFSALAFKPILRQRKKTALVERDLPLELMSVSADLDLNIAFEKCIANASKSGLATSEEFKKILFEIREKGVSVQEALMNFAKRNKSIAIKRAVMQLANFYEQGSRGKAGNRKSAKAVRRLASELLAKQRAESKEFSGKLVVFSLLFIAASAIAPALFQSFVIVGSMVLKMSITQAQVFLAITMGFPLLDLVVLFYIRAKTPVVLRG